MVRSVRRVGLAISGVPVTMKRSTTKGCTHRAGSTHVGDLAVTHLDASARGVVEPPPGRRRRPGVRLGTVGGEAHGGLQDLLPLGKMSVDRREAFLG